MLDEVQAFGKIKDKSINDVIKTTKFLFLCRRGNFPFRIRPLPFLRHLEIFELLLKALQLKRKTVTTQNRTRSLLTLIFLPYHYTTTPIRHNSEKI